MDIRGAGRGDSDQIEDTYSVSPKNSTTQVVLPLSHIDFFRTAIGTLAKATILSKKMRCKLTCRCGDPSCCFVTSKNSVANVDWEIKQESPSRRSQPPPKE